MYAKLSQQSTGPDDAVVDVPGPELDRSNDMSPAPPPTPTLPGASSTLDTIGTIDSSRAGSPPTAAQATTVAVFSSGAQLGAACSRTVARGQRNTPSPASTGGGVAALPETEPGASSGLAVDTNNSADRVDKTPQQSEYIFGKRSRAPSSSRSVDPGLSALKRELSSAGEQDNYGGAGAGGVAAGQSKSRKRATRKGNSFYPKSYFEWTDELMVRHVKKAAGLVSTRASECIRKITVLL